MAVVSISRIQIRRGRKNQGSGLPQLASGELGWAVDTQELYIGNGSVAEGSPYVGNTKLLSEHDNLFEFADTYSYKSADGYIQTGPTPNNPILRTLQDRLDDRISIRSFGALGDGTNQTAALQRAVDQLYLNPANKGVAQTRVELIIEPGEYLISNTIYLPPFVKIRGAGADKTIITTSGSFAAFQTVNETSTPGVYANDSNSTTLNQARNIEITGITIRTTGFAALALQSCKDSLFKNIVLQGNWQIGNAANAVNTAIELGGLSTAVTCQNNVFEDVKITNFSYVATADDDIINNTWNRITVAEVSSGFVFGKNTLLGTSGQLTGPKNNIVSNSNFDNVMQTAIFVYTGLNNVSDTNKFYNVGNDGGTADNNQYPILQFNDQGNYSTNDYFERSELLGYDSTFLFNVPYVAEVVGGTITKFNHPHTLNLTEYGQPTKLFKLPATGSGKGYEIDYMYRSSQAVAMRSGKITLVVDPVNNTYNLSDDYEFTGDSFYSGNLQFTAQNYDENSNGVVDTVAIMVLNSTSNDDAEFIYTVKYKS